MAFPEFIELPHTGFGAGRLITVSLSISMTFALVTDLIELPHTGAGAG